MSNYLEANFEAIAEYLSKAKVMHISSFLDDVTPGSLSRVIEAAKTINPAVKVSLDPGHVWCANTSSEIERIVRLSDYLLLNYREFMDLALARSTSDKGPPRDIVTAGALLARCKAGAVLIIKGSSGASSFRRVGDRVVKHFYPQASLVEHEIKDSTGAGDVFAAGVLAVLSSSTLQTGLGSLLGMRLARHALQHEGTRGHSGLAEATRLFMRSQE